MGGNFKRYTEEENRLIGEFREKNLSLREITKLRSLRKIR